MSTSDSIIVCVVIVGILFIAVVLPILLGMSFGSWLLGAFFLALAAGGVAAQRS